MKWCKITPFFVGISQQDEDFFHHGRNQEPFLNYLIHQISYPVLFRDFSMKNPYLHEGFFPCTKICFLAQPSSFYQEKTPKMLQNYLLIRKKDNRDMVLTHALHFKLQYKHNNNSQQVSKRQGSETLPRWGGIAHFLHGHNLIITCKLKCLLDFTLVGYSTSYEQAPRSCKLKTLPPLRQRFTI